MWSIIERYKSDGFDISGNNYFFITPSINDGVLKRWIERQPNVFWINWNTKQFLEFMHNEISIENTSFSRALRYSIHAYIDMYFKYLDVNNGTMPENEALYIQNVIVKVPRSEFDGYMKDIINKFVTYCDFHGLSACCEEIKALNWDKLKLIESNLEDYEVENLDVI